MKGRYRTNRRGVEGWIRRFNRTQSHVVNQGIAWGPTGARFGVSLQDQMLPLCCIEKLYWPQIIIIYIGFFFLVTE